MSNRKAISPCGPDGVTSKTAAAKPATAATSGQQTTLAAGMTPMMPIDAKKTGPPDIKNSVVWPAL